MKRALLIALGAVMALQPARADAQIFNGTVNDVEWLKFVGGSGQTSTWSGVQVGPYRGQFESKTSWPVTWASVEDQVARTSTTVPFALYCVDYEHYASNSNGLVSTTALGGAPDLSSSNTRLQSFDRYQQSAYLSSLFTSWEAEGYAANLADSDGAGGYQAGDFNQQNVWSGLHAAIWNVATGPDDFGSGSTAFARDYFLGLDHTGFNTDGWYVVSEYDALSDSHSGQEFLMQVSVPEPSTALLLFTGLFLLVGVNRKRIAEV